MNAGTLTNRDADCELLICTFQSACASPASDVHLGSGSGSGTGSGSEQNLAAPAPAPAPVPALRVGTGQRCQSGSQFLGIPIFPNSQFGNWTELSLVLGI